MRGRLLLLSFLLFSLLFGNFSALAQNPPAPIAVGENRLGEINATTPQPTFVFNATAGQVINVEVLAVTDNLAPTITVSNQQGALIQAVGNATAQNTTTLAVTFPETNAYLIQVASATNTPGQFVITISEGGEPPVALLENQPASGVLDPGASIRYSFFGNAASVLQLQITGDETRSPSVRLINGSGIVLAVTVTDLPFVMLGIPMGAEQSYVLSLTNDRPDGLPMPYQVLLVPVGPPSAAVPDVTPEPGAPAGSDLPTLPTSGPCVLATQGQNVNVRQGPAQEYSAVSQISPTGIYNVIGRNENSSWYKIRLENGTEGWVSGGVTRLGGDCGAVALASYPPLPAQQPGAPTATYTPTLPGNVTATATQPGAPTATYTYTPTPTQGAQVAPPDQDVYVLEVPYNGSGQISQVISWPNGDRSDQIRIRVTGMDPAVNSAVNFNIRLTCSGTGAEYITWTGGGGCGTLVKHLFTYDRTEQNYTVTFAATTPIDAYVNFTISAEMDQ